MSGRRKRNKPEAAPAAEEPTVEAPVDAGREQPSGIARQTDPDDDDDFPRSSPRPISAPLPRPAPAVYDAADVVHEAWFTDHSGGDEIKAYRTGRAVHAIGWLTLASQLQRVYEGEGEYESGLADESEEERRARVQQARERDRLVARSRQRLAALLVESAHRFAPGLAESDLVPAIRSHEIAVQEVVQSLDEWRAEGLHHALATEEVVRAYEPNLVRFPFEYGPHNAESRRLLDTFCDAVSPRLRDFLHLGVAVDSLFRGPVPLRDPGDHWRGMAPVAAFRVRPDESGKLTGLCSRLGFDRGVVDRVRHLIENTRGPESINDIDDLIRGTLRVEATPKHHDGPAPSSAPIPAEVEQTVSADATEPKGGDAGVAPNEDAAFEIEQPPSTVGRITMEEFEWMTEILSESTRSMDIQKLIAAYFERFKKDIGRNRMYALRNQARKGIRFGSSDDATGEQPKH